MHRDDRHIVNYVNGQQIVGRFLGGLENLITLSLSLSLSQALAYKRGSTTSYYTRGAPASRYGFLCRNAREAAVFFVPSDKDLFNYI